MAGSAALNIVEPESTRPLAYMRQLDGLRCIAVSLVLVQHFIPSELLYGVNWGRLGVRLFFVLSGFLITKILLDCRNQTDAGAVRPRFAAHQFYARRFLRIFPIYYLMLFAALLLGNLHVEREFFWHLAYLSNVKFSFVGGFTAANTTAHFWSLAVEEQFYLLWPWLILFLPRKAILPAVFLVFLVGPFYRAAGVLLYWPAVSLKLFTPACMDTLGIGALLAVLERHARWTPGAFNRLTQGAAAIGLLASLYLFQLPGDQPAFVVLGDTATACVFAWCVWGAANGFRGPLGAVLSWGPAVYLGRISYGIYVIHLFVPWLYARHLVNLGLPDPNSFPLAIELAAYTAITILLAAASWHLYEKPLNALKKHFPYTPAPAQSPPSFTTDPAPRHEDIVPAQHNIAPSKGVQS